MMENKMVEKRLPFTDPLWEKETERQQYTDECDRLSEIEVQTCCTSFGRWFLEDGMLSTWVVLPSVEKLPVQKLYVYSYAMEKLHTKIGQEALYTQMQREGWIGEKGLKSLKRAFKYLSKKGED